MCGRIYFFIIAAKIDQKREIFEIKLHITIN